MYPFCHVQQSQQSKNNLCFSKNRHNCSKAMYTITKGKWRWKCYFNTIINIWHFFLLFFFFCVSYLETCTQPSFKKSSFFLIQSRNSIKDKIPILFTFSASFTLLISFCLPSCVYLSPANLFPRPFLNVVYFRLNM